MKKSLIIIIINLFLPLFLFVIVPSIFIKTKAGVSNSSTNTFIPFYDKQTYTETFFSDQPNLESIKLFFKNPLIKNNSKINFLIQSPDDERTLVFYGANIGDPGEILLKFPPFSNNSNTKFSFFLTTENTLDNSLYILVNNQRLPAFESFYSRNNIYENIKENFVIQSSNFLKRSPLHTILYVFLILLCNILIIKKREKS